MSRARSSRYKYTTQTMIRNKSKTLVLTTSLVSSNSRCMRSSQHVIRCSTSHSLTKPLPNQEILSFKRKKSMLPQTTRWLFSTQRSEGSAAQTSVFSSSTDLSHQENSLQFTSQKSRSQSLEHSRGTKSKLAPLTCAKTTSSKR